MSEKTLAYIEWSERITHLWLTTLEEEIESCEKVNIYLQDSWRLPEMVPIPTELVTKYKTAMTALWEVEAAVKQIRQESA
jgi:hypothetical protein